MALSLLLENKITYTQMYLPTKAVLNVRSFACEWQGCAKPEGIFPNNFNQIHPYLFLNISLKMAKKPPNI